MPNALLRTKKQGYAFFLALDKDDKAIDEMLPKWTVKADIAKYLIETIRKVKSDKKTSVARRFGIDGTTGAACMRQAAAQLFAIFGPPAAAAQAGPPAAAAQTQKIKVADDASVREMLHLIAVPTEDPHRPRR